MIFTDLNQVIESFPKWPIRFSNYSPISVDLDDILSGNNLEQLKTKLGDVHKARDLVENERRVYFNRAFQGFDAIIDSVSEQLNLSLTPTGFYWYPYNGYCGWHTNNDKEGERVYLVWAAEDKKSFFRFQDPKTQKIVTNWDEKGWSLKRFSVSKERTLWHCVGSKTNRISIGFKVN